MCTVLLPRHSLAWKLPICSGFCCWISTRIFFLFLLHLYCVMFESVCVLFWPANFKSFILSSMFFSSVPLNHLKCYTIKRFFWSFSQFAFRSCFKGLLENLSESRSVTFWFLFFKYLFEKCSMIALVQWHIRTEPDGSLYTFRPWTHSTSADSYVQQFSSPFIRECWFFAYVHIVRTPEE